MKTNATNRVTIFNTPQIQPAGKAMTCRHCGTPLKSAFLDLGSAPPSNAYLSEMQLAATEKYYPLRLFVCGNCWLVQSEDYATREDLFTQSYAYFSSFSNSWLAHARRYVSEMISRFGLVADSTVVEIAANDGYLLQYVQQNGIGCYGIEPTQSTAEAARSRGIEILCDFFGSVMGRTLSLQGRSADLIVANNVLAHVQDINDFVAGFTYLLKPNGIATFEFPHLLQMVKNNQFDTAYHEHYSYLSFMTVNRILNKNGLIIFDVQELQTHGGSLRVFAQRKDTGKQVVFPSVAYMINKECREGIATDSFYADFQFHAEKVKNELLSFLRDAKSHGKTICAYGAAAKGNTLLNFCNIRKDLIEFVVDASPHKQGKFLPGSHIPIVAEEKIKEEKPDYILILPWNLKEEITAQLAYVRKWGGLHVLAIPDLQIF